jgi:hypothetical protein
MRSHWWPRTREGRISLIVFLVLFLLAEPPAVFLIGNRIEPRILGMPFLYAYLLLIYSALIAVLIRALRRGL